MLIEDTEISLAGHKATIKNAVIGAAANRLANLRDRAE